MRAETTQEADRGGRGIKLRQLVFLNRLPVARRRRVYGGRLEDRGGDAVRQRAINNVAEEGRMNIDKFGKESGRRMYVRVSGDPANIGHAGEPVIGVDIEGILKGQSCTEKVPSCRMHNTLRLARGAGCLQGIEKCVDKDERANVSHKG